MYAYRRKSNTRSTLKVFIFIFNNGKIKNYLRHSIMGLKLREKDKKKVTSESVLYPILLLNRISSPEHQGGQNFDQKNKNPKEFVYYLFIMIKSIIS